MKIAIIGSTNYENVRRIYSYLKHLQSKFGDSLIVLSSGGKYGAEKFVKTICKWKLGIKYIEYLPLCNMWNADCEGNGYKKYLYNKEYNPKYIHAMSVKLIKDSDLVIYFSHARTFDNKHKTLANSIKRLNKKFIIVP